MSEKRRKQQEKALTIVASLIILSRIYLEGVFKRISGVKVFSVLIETCK